MLVQARSPSGNRSGCAPPVDKLPSLPRLLPAARTLVVLLPPDDPPLRPRLLTRFAIQYSALRLTRSIYSPPTCSLLSLAQTTMHDAVIPTMNAHPRNSTPVSHRLNAARAHLACQPTTPAVLSPPHPYCAPAKILRPPTHAPCRTFTAPSPWYTSLGIAHPRARYSSRLARLARPSCPSPPHVLARRLARTPGMCLTASSSTVWRVPRNIRTCPAARRAPQPPPLLLLFSRHVPSRHGPVRPPDHPNDSERCAGKAYL